MHMQKKERSLLLIFLVGILLAGSVYLYGGKPGLQQAQASGHGGQGTSPLQETAANNSKPIKVNVQGDVNHPGEYQLPNDSRVADAIEAAGGARDDAQVQQLNLAAVVSEGESVVVPGPSTAVGNDGTQQADGKMNLNTATATQLDKLPGIGSARANAIVDYRNENGPFYAVDDLNNVPGFGTVLVDKIRDLVTVN